MEWARHESRCPICRQRFTNVRRLPMLGVISSSRDVKVPHRDQVYHPHGNVATGPVGSYAETKCSTCHAETDEHLLLLCDLCDTASHTYCVGLGYTVPEGDWFCHDCAISRETNTNVESNHQNVSPAAEPSVTIDISDIVRETGSRVVKKQPRASYLQQNLSSPSQQNLSSPLQQYLSSPSVIPSSDRLSRFKGKSPVVGVHHMQCNIQSLRQNWNALRTGSLRFHGNSFQPGSTVSQNQDSSGPSNKTLTKRDSKDVDKAWKMMDRAKRTQPTHQRTCSIPQGVDKPSGSGGARKLSFGHCNVPKLKDQHSKTLDLRNIKKEMCEYSRLDHNLKNRSILKLGEKKQSRVTCEEMMHVRDYTDHSEGYCDRPLSRKVHTSIQAVPCREDGERNGAEEQSSSACLVTSADLASSHGKTTDDAKTEIQSLVKLNLKLLTRETKLGVDTFKVVARQATHTILAACSSEQPKSSISSSSVCSHADNALQFQKYTLMPNCCRQCFYAFVNKVVNSIMLEKLGSA
uniref:Bromodomain adjacent to zinc finger domain protein 1A n=1 Tax=Cajanus cajan TaxID=3821 RepID=A0A151SPR9_CAJCA|nr:Bromodomain adjacent to zinc finger domain protein 1A [Cajanus cajan]